MKKTLRFELVVKIARLNGAWSEEEAKEVEKLGSWEEFWKHPRAAYLSFRYACDVLEKRWEEAEKKVLSKSVKWACWYALRVIKGPWLEMEETILNDPEWFRFYKLNVLGQNEAKVDEKRLAVGSCAGR